MFVARNDRLESASSVHREDSGIQPRAGGEGTIAHAPGDLVAGRYRLGSLIARGGMGTVWEARDETTGHDLAVKLPTVLDDICGAEASRYSSYEATAAAGVCHPAVVKILHFGLAEDDQPFIAMELLKGRSLREAIRREGGQHAVDAVRLLLPVLDALGCAHGGGIVHCDVKPENVVLVGPGDGIGAKLVDFGIARILGVQPQPTASEYVVGSLAYMSPERVRGSSNVDARLDLWSFIVVLYETIRGERPWHAENCLALRRAIKESSVPSLVGERGVDEALWAVLKRGLDKDPAGRWQSAADLIETLVAWLNAHGERWNLSMTPWAQGIRQRSTIQSKSGSIVPTIQAVQ